MAAGEQNLLSTEIVNRGVKSSSGSPAFSVRVRSRLPDFVASVNLKYVKLGYHYLMSHAVYVAAAVPLLVAALSAEEAWRKIWDNAAATYDLATVLCFVAVVVFTVFAYFMSKPKPIYLLDFACFKPSDDFKVTKEQFINMARSSGKFDESTLEFKKRVLESSGIGDETYVPKSIGSPENTATMKEGRAEASTVMFGAIDELFEKTKIRPKEVGVLVVNCSIFNPTPSLSAMIINHYKLRGNILSFNLGGMGCSAGIIALDLARDMLQANPNNYALVVSSEMVSFNWYSGKDRPMLIPNCFFRMGCSAVLLSNRRRDYGRAKYRLEHIVRTHKGADDRSFRSIYQEEDDEGKKGLKISKDLVQVGGEALKTNITTLGPLVLPVSEQLIFFATLVWGHLFGSSKTAPRPYIPDYKLAFDHFCVYAPSKLVLDELQANMGLRDRDMEPSRATLHRFGNTSSSSIWYELAYLEAKGKVNRGDRLWQIVFGSGFKCNSAVWRAMGRVRMPTMNPWLDCLDRYPGAI